MDPWDVALSVGMFAATALLIMAVFGQPGKIRVSAQREAALATGHTDRKTVFESPILRPLMWILLAMGHRVSMPRTKRWIGRTLVAAGSPNYYTAEEYLALAILTGLTMGAVIEAAHLLLTGRVSFVLLAAGLVAGTGLEIYRLYDKAAKRTRGIAKRLPYTLDLIALAMGAGATFTEAVKAVAAAGDEPIIVELRALLAELDLGTPRRNALQNLARRVPLPSLRSIVASVIQAEQLGTPLADVLHDHSTLLRLQRSVRAENAAAIAGVRILVPCLLLVMAVILAVFAPAIVRTVRGGLF